MAGGMTLCLSGLALLIVLAGAGYQRRWLRVMSALTARQRWYVWSRGFWYEQRVVWGRHKRPASPTATACSGHCSCETEKG